MQLRAEGEESCMKERIMLGQPGGLLAASPRCSGPTVQTECGLGEAQNVGLAATEAARPAHGPAPGGDEPAQGSSVM